jgi:glutamate dehydrogenase
VTPNSAIFACSDDHNVALNIELKIDKEFPTYRLQSYRTKGAFGSESTEVSKHLRLYFLTRSGFAEDSVPFEETDIQKVASKDFLARTNVSTINRYQEMLKEAVGVRGPVILISDKPETNETRLMVGYKRVRTHSYFTAVSDVLNAYGIHSNRKYIEHFANGVSIFSVYFDKGVPQPTLNNIQEDLSLVYVLPRTSLTPLFRNGKLTAPEVVYAYAGWKFVHQFLTRFSDEYNSLANAVSDNPVLLGFLNTMKNRLSKDTFTEPRILDTIFRHPELIKALYQDFYQHHFVGEGVEPKAFDPFHNEELGTELTKAVNSNIDRLILLMFLTFNRHILKTNFYRNVKTSLSFRLDPTFLSSFLSSSEYPETPHAIFFVVGSEFRGFHIRFRDVARGGIRLVRSANRQAYLNNADTLFNENYRLAYTQQRKNKDIPEGGSKGVILLSYEHQDRYTLAFKKYIGGLLDLMMPNDEIVDHLGKEELLFLGPDEGTADLMDWASLYAKQRGYKFWKSFTTGKSVEYGGIPHDLYGMTTRSVHQYVLGILRKKGLDESTITKFQTGGPDGDLGSNEIKISLDHTLSIVDGSGVLHDPDGINREELTRLADARQMVRAFDQSKLGPKGFFVDVEDRDITLPDGTSIESGLQFRNQYHLFERAAADLFVPCGGRPSAVHINNYHRLLDEEGVPRFKYIVEGANLFLTQEARLKLEEAGVIIFKDASANKGGVTSSSLEVLSGLSLTDEEFAPNMQVKEGNIPTFYKNYVEEVVARIEAAAAMEFECIWREHERTGIKKSIISDLVSNKINQLIDRIMASDLWSDLTLRKSVIQTAVPKTLQELVGY